MSINIAIVDDDVPQMQRIVFGVARAHPDVSLHLFMILPANSGPVYAEVCAEAPENCLMYDVVKELPMATPEAVVGYLRTRDQESKFAYILVDVHLPMFENRLGGGAIARGLDLERQQGRVAWFSMGRDGAGETMGFVDETVGALPKVSKHPERPLFLGNWLATVLPEEGFSITKDWVALLTRQTNPGRGMEDESFAGLLHYTPRWTQEQYRRAFEGAVADYAQWTRQFLRRPAQDRVQIDRDCSEFLGDVKILLDSKGFERGALEERILAFKRKFRMGQGPRMTPWCSWSHASRYYINDDFTPTSRNAPIMVERASRVVASIAKSTWEHNSEKCQLTVHGAMVGGVPTTAMSLTARQGAEWPHGVGVLKMGTELNSAKSLVGHCLWWIRARTTGNAVRFVDGISGVDLQGSDGWVSGEDHVEHMLVFMPQ